MAMILETARLIVREVEADDAGFVLALLNDPGWLTNIGDRGVRTIEDARAHIESGYRADYARRGYGFWLVALRTGAPIGVCGFKRREGLPAPDMGFAYLREHTGRGYGREAGEAVLAYGLRTLALDPILAITKLDNAASIALLRRLGFLEEAIVQLPDIATPSRLFRHVGATV